MIEVDCKKCAFCGADGCSKYGHNADIAVERCASDNFTNYLPQTDWKPPTPAPTGAGSEGEHA